MSSEPETISYERFARKVSELNEATKELERLRSQAKMAEKLAGQVEALKAEKKQLAEQHAADLAKREKHDVLRDKGITDPEVRDLFLSKLGDAEDLGAAIDGFYGQDADVPAVLRPFLPERPAEGDQSQQHAQDDAQQSRQQSRGRLPPSDGAGRTPPNSRTALSAEAVANMSDDELMQHLPAIAQQTGRQSIAHLAGLFGGADKP